MPDFNFAELTVICCLSLIYNIPYLGMKQEKSLSACFILMALDSQQPFGSRADNRVENSFPAGIVNQSALVAIFQQHGFCLFTQNVPSYVDCPAFE